ncbi:uncharacterized protein LOC131178356 [Hevea brasiliensis]|uniref:uncharacterized protein LOC131178356 n=1 Tax=Hevea brasiliensis TaxID=3981 RepID=UPI0025CC7BA4|nr:uncharacterized protein LOC131178356 [Hevea brasiliensis]
MSCGENKQRKNAALPHPISLSPLAFSLPFSSCRPTSAPARYRQPSPVPEQLPGDGSSEQETTERERRREEKEERGRACDRGPTSRRRPGRLPRPFPVISSATDSQDDELPDETSGTSFGGRRKENRRGKVGRKLYGFLGFRSLFRRFDRWIGNPRPLMDSGRRDLRDRTGPALIGHRLKKAIIGRSRSLGAIGARIAHRCRDCIFSQIRLPDSPSQNVVNITVNPSIFRRS